MERTVGCFGSSDQMKIDEKRMIQIARGLNGDVEKTEDLRNEKNPPLPEV
jgi:hypothetical protein